MKNFRLGAVLTATVMCLCISSAEAVDVSNANDLNAKLKKKIHRQLKEQQKDTKKQTDKTFEDVEKSLKEKFENFGK